MSKPDLMASILAHRDDELSVCNLENQDNIARQLKIMDNFIALVLAEVNELRDKLL